MTQQRWMVIKVTPPTMLLVSNDGEFRRVPAVAGVGPGVVIGNLPAPMTTDVQRQTSAKAMSRARSAASGWRLWAAAAAVILMLVPGYFWANRPAALVAIDINPSLELYVGADGRVREVETLNPEARDLVRGAGLKGESWEKAVEEIIDRSSEAGFLKDSKQNAIAVSVVPLRTDRQPVDAKRAAAEIDQLAKERGLRVTLAAREAPREQLSAARKEGLSLNRFILKEEASRAGVTLEPDYVREAPLTKLMQDAGLPVEGADSSVPAGSLPGQAESAPGANPGANPATNPSANGERDVSGTAATREVGRGTGDGASGAGDRTSGLGSRAGEVGSTVLPMAPDNRESGTTAPPAEGNKESGSPETLFSSSGNGERQSGAPGEAEDGTADSQTLMETGATETGTATETDTSSIQIKGGRATDGDDSDLESRASTAENDGDGIKPGGDGTESGRSAGQPDTSGNEEPESNPDTAKAAETSDGQDSGDPESGGQAPQPSGAQEDTSVDDDSDDNDVNDDNDEAGEASTMEVKSSEDGGSD